MSDASRAHLILGVLLGVSLTICLQSVLSKSNRRRNPSKAQPESKVTNGVVGLIGNTPLVRIESLSNALGVEILGKAEFLNPGGSVKDRVALRMIEDAEKNGLLHPGTGSTIFEGTVGSTGISIATIARAKGYETTIIMPDDVAEEKAKTLKALGANVQKVRPASIIDQKQFVNLAKRRASEFEKAHLTTEQRYTRFKESDDIGLKIYSDESQPPQSNPKGFFADQFENKSNYDAHFDGTGPEIWDQVNGRIDAFVSGAGTGGTISGIGCFLKQKSPSVKVILADPEGSGLYNKIKHGVMYDSKESEGTRRRHQVDTVVEGIGINRLTQNFALGLPIIDDAYRITDAEAVSMSRHLVKHDGLFLGSSSACNLVACVKLAKKLKLEQSQADGNEQRKLVIVTILCDSGTRHYSKFWNDEYLRKAGISNNPSIV